MKPKRRDRSMAIAFDLFGVLMTPGLQSSIDILAALLDRERDSVVLAYRRFEPAFDEGRLSPEQFWFCVNAELGTSVPWGQLDEAVLASYQPISVSWRLLVDLQRAGVPLALASNTRRSWFEYLDQRWGIRKHFTSVALSCDVGSRKPSTSILDKVSRDLDLSPHQILFIDDDSSNVAAATRAGFPAIHFDTAFDLVPALRCWFPAALKPYAAHYSGVAPITPRGDVLLQRRDNKKGIENPGLLSVFGGDAVGDETPVSCARRELAEETGLRPLASDFVPFHRLAVPIEPSGWKECNYFWVPNIEPTALSVMEGAGVEAMAIQQALNRADLAAHARSALAGLSDRLFRD